MAEFRERVFKFPLSANGESTESVIADEALSYAARGVYALLASIGTPVDLWDIHQPGGPNDTLWNTVEALEELYGVGLVKFKMEAGQ